MHWYGFSGDAFKVAELLDKLKFTEESAKYIVVDGLDSLEELEHLDNYMCNTFVQNWRKNGSKKKGVGVSTMADVFLEISVWGMQHMKRFSRIIDIYTIEIEWCHSINDQVNLEASWTNTLS